MLVLGLVVLGLLAGAPSAFADAVVDARLQCQMEYGAGTPHGNACQRGVALATQTPDKLQKAMTECTKGFEHAALGGACQRGVGLYTRVSGNVREQDKAGFSYTWGEKDAPLTINMGPAQLLIGDAERQMNRCLEHFEGSRHPPSCLSGFTAQQRPSDPTPPSLGD